MRGGASRVLEAEIVRKCLARSERQCSFVEHRNLKASASVAHRPRPSAHPPCRQVVYRRYASLYVLAGVDEDENPLATLEVMQA